MKILVADDEFFARKAIVQMIRDWDRQADVLEAEDGSSALQALETDRPDVLLTDIRMPGMDGIQLAAHIYHRDPQMSVVIISGFDEFPYAQEAIRYKVENYLLKPIDRQELYPLLDQLKARIAAKQEEAKEHALAAGFYGEIDPRHSPLAADIEGRCYRTIVFWLHPGQYEALALLFKEMFKRQRRHHVVMSDRHHPHLLLAWVCGSETGLAYESIRIVCDSLNDQLRRETGKPCLAMGASARFSELGRLAESYKAAKLAALQSFAASTRTVVCSESIRKTFRYDADLIHEWSLAFQRKMAMHQAEEAADMIRSWLKRFSECQYSAYMLQDWFAATVNVMNTLIGRSSHEVEASFIEQRSLFDYCSLQHLEEGLTGWVHAVCELLKQKEAKFDLVENIKKDVEIHYASRITLEELAKHKYFVDPSYLSRLFKRKSGMGFASYLLSVRMEKARQMLESGSGLSVSDVASAVGFNDDSYFIQMYKKYFGETPGKSRNSKPVVSDND
ncbi:hypothetical protein PACILC2_31900 [Paenibacillus cisolokensis]|uniref:Response regulator n=2 Tax=Paenibacillus cisolokensis TaxID=1658519 RepID=A0ABQ4N8Q1_9BACL|nr:hypothetical protein PACILC2_31900 [Paenibacillus cisolokensis]